MNPDINRTAAAAQSKLEQGATPEDTLHIFQWTGEMADRLTEKDPTYALVLSIRRKSAQALMEASSPQAGWGQRIRSIFGRPTIDAALAEQILAVLPSADIQPHVYKAVERAGGKKGLVLLLTKDYSPEDTRTKAADALLKLPLETSELLCLVSVHETAIEALKRLAQLSFDHDVFLQTLRSAHSVCRKRKELNDIGDELLNHTQVPQDLKIIARSCSGATRVHAAEKWATTATRFC